MYIMLNNVETDTHTLPPTAQFVMFSLAGLYTDGEADFRRCKVKNSVYKLWNGAFVAFLITLVLGIGITLGLPIAAFWVDDAWSIDIMRGLRPHERMFFYVPAAAIPIAVVACGLVAGSGRISKAFRILTTILTVAATALLLLGLAGVGLMRGMAH